MTPSDLKELVKKHNIKMIDAKFVDFLGQWKHLTYPIERLEEGIEEGFGFDGSSVAGWRAINSSDMLMKPDPSTAILDPFLKTPTLSILCDVIDPITHESYSRDPRSLAKRAVAYLKSTGIADTAYFGPEAEFFIFDDVRYEYSANSSFHSLDSGEAIWNTGREEFPNLGYKIRHKEGYFPVPPADTLQDLRNEMCLELEKAGVPIERQHHEVATAGQAEIDVRFAPLRSMGDSMMYYKYILKNVAKKYNKVVTL